jgi:hypothetical protein
MTTLAAAAFSAAPAAPAVAAATPAVAAAPAVAATPAAATPAVPTWYDGFTSPDVKAWTQAKGFPNPEQVAESAYNLEKLIGFDKAGRTLVIPKEDASPEEIKAFQAKLGVPESPDAYKLPLPADADPELVKTMQGWMHKAGATPKMAETLTKEFVDFSVQQKAKEEKALFDLSDKAFGETTARWGKDADANMEIAKRFTAQLLPAEVTMDDGSKVGREQFLAKVFNSTGATGAMLELFARAGKGMGEHVMHQTTGGGMPDNSPAAASAKIKQLQADPAWTKAYLNGDKEKLALMTALQKQAAGVE